MSYDELIDPSRRWCEFYRLDIDHYDLVFQGRQGRYDAIAVPGFWLETTWLWQSPAPWVEDILLEITSADYAAYLVDRLRQRRFL